MLQLYVVADWCGYLSVNWADCPATLYALWGNGLYKYTLGLVLACMFFIGYVYALFDSRKPILSNEFKKRLKVLSLLAVVGSSMIAFVYYLHQ